jgi:AbrB family looped-hinge helix DNA binding protein
MLVAKKTYTIQENGQITLPIEFRRRYGLKKGDVVVVKETDEGLLISPKEALVMKLLDEIGEGLKARGITLEELIESGREIRGELIREKYGLDPDADE